MKITVILMTDGEWCRGDSYEEALDKLDHQINEDYYREQRELQDGKTSGPELYDKEEVVPKMMILTDDATAEIDRYGQLLTEGGSWHITIPLVGKRPPNPDYRFCTMQRLKEEDFQKELWNYRLVKYSEEFNKFCGQRDGNYKPDRCTGCPFNSRQVNIENGEPTCFQLWYEKYKKPELDKEEKDGKTET